MPASDLDSDPMELPPILYTEPVQMVETWSSQPSTESGSSFVPPASGDLLALLSEVDVNPYSEELRKEAKRLECISDAAVARRILANYRAQARVDGFCWLSPLKPTKTGGYIQVSAEGANKFATLQELMVWAADMDLEPAQQASHLCCQPACTVETHIVPESAEENNHRKNCRVHVDCPHCTRKIVICVHNPLCIKYCPGFATWEDFLRDGVCARV